MENERKTAEEIIIEILSKAEYQGLKYGEIVEHAKQEHLSPRTVDRYLKALVQKGFIKKNGAYRLAVEAITQKNAQRTLFSVLAMHLFDELHEKTGQGSLKDEEFIDLFTRRLGILALYTFLVGMEKATGNQPEEGGRWIEQGFGTLTQKNGWRSCVNRQVHGGVVQLREPIRLGEPLRPEVFVEDGTVYVRLPTAVQKGLAGKVFKQLPKPVPRERVNLLKECLKRLYPAETAILDDAMNKISEAVAVSKKR